jgi:excinuclease UvrABC nuclease subunit
MTLDDLKKLDVPDVPGVYTFRQGRETLYIGKATSLKDRLRSYFAADLMKARGSRIVDMVTKSNRIEWQETGSVLEALVLEAALIKRYLPKANIDEKDDKSYLFVVFTKEEYPAVEFERGRTIEFAAQEAKKYKNVFGPFVHGNQIRQAMELLRKIFPYRDAKCKPRSGRACFSRQIGLCPGCCTGEITPHEYAKTMRRLCLILSGKIGAAEKDLERGMKAAAKARKFEEADRLKRDLFALQHIRDVSLIRAEAHGPAGFRVEALDVAHYSGSNTVGVMTVLEDGWPKKSAYRTFTMRGSYRGDDLAALRELVTRRLRHPEWGVPDLLVVDGNLQRGVAEAVIAGVPQTDGEIVPTEYGHLDDAKPVAKMLAVPVVSVVKDDRHKFSRIDGDPELIERHRKEILLANSESHRFAVATLRAKTRKQATGRTRRRA